MASPSQITDHRRSSVGTDQDSLDLLGPGKEAFLTDREEAERLLADDWSQSPHRTPRAQRQDRWRWRSGGGRIGDDDASVARELLFKAEDADGARSSSPSESVNSSLRSTTPVEQRLPSSMTRRSRYRYAAIYAVTLAAFLVLLYAAFRVSHRVSHSTGRPAGHVLSNGTRNFAPTTILISLDGFRADFVNRGLTPTLSSFIRQGVSAKYMLPSFPSLTFPNHFSLVTGLYPESHGIVGNTFWDPHMQEEFYYTDPKKSMRPEFWNAEPLWETAELQGVPAAIHMWPGSEAHIGGKELEPAYLDKFNGNEALDVKVSRILHWLDIPGPNDEGASEDAPRPQLIAAYVPNVDADGHLYGPNSTYIRSTIAEVDGMLGSLLSGIEERNLSNIVNVVVVSDHGMAGTSVSRLIQLEDLVDRSLIERIDGWPLYGLRPKDPSPAQLRNLYQDILHRLEDSRFSGNVEAYLRDENMPERYHFSKNDRIAPIWLVPSPGWAIVRKEEFDIEAALESGESYHPRGLHGYDHEHPLMRAIFVAKGPAFPHPRGSQIEPFQNVELYNMICDSLGLVPSPNNGTMRLPLKTSGLHDFDAPDELYEDFPNDHLLEPGTPNLPGPLSKPDPLAEGGTFSSGTEPEVQDDEEHEVEEEHKTTWLEWINGKIEDVKSWASGVFGGDGSEARTKRMHSSKLQ